MKIRRWGVRVGRGYDADGPQALIARRRFTKRGAERTAYYRYEQPTARRSMFLGEDSADWAAGPHAKVVRL